MPVHSPFLPVEVPNFDEAQYMEANPAVRNAVRGGLAESPLDHFLRFGVDQNKSPVLRQEGASLVSAADRFLVSESGFCLLLGWLADEGSDAPRMKLIGAEFAVEFPTTNVFRYARKDIEAQLRGGTYDYGFVAFGRSPSRTLLKQTVLFEVASVAGSFRATITPEIVSDKRLLDTVLHLIATCEAHGGKQVALADFLCGKAGETLTQLFSTHVASSTARPYIERFRSRRVSSSLVTVLFGSTEPIKLQPMLFNRAGIDFGEWIYVCNSPEDAEEVLRYARLISDLYDVMITVIALGDNAGFGAANNLAVRHSASDRIFLMNPDVYPVQAYASHMQEVLLAERLGETLWGGLLFYDEHNLMHSGMFLESDSFIRRNALNSVDDATRSHHVRLLRVEHFDKGVPFVDDDWQELKRVPAASGAVMAFEKAHFEKLGGFSERYIYGHYEDADLSFRWNASVGPVCVHPRIRLVHLEGQGARVRGEEYRGASIANRYLFTAQHGDEFDRQSDAIAPASAKDL